MWARALPGQVGYEVSRGFLNVFFGLAEISRATAGNAYHWFFVCKLLEGFLYLIPGIRRCPTVFRRCPTASRQNPKLSYGVHTLVNGN